MGSSVAVVCSLYCFVLEDCMLGSKAEQSTASYGIITDKTRMTVFFHSVQGIENAQNDNVIKLLEAC